MNTFNVQPEDVMQVATSLKMNPTPTEVQEVISRYPGEQKQDPTGTWNLVVEHILYQVLEERVKE